MLDALGADALRTAIHGGGECALLRISLPWIRSLPLAAVSALEVRIDGHPVPSPLAVLGERSVSVDDLAHETGWWFVQDRLAVQLDHALSSGIHRVRLEFRLAVPYLQAGPDGPLTLPFVFERDLVASAPGSIAGVARDVA